MNHGQYLEKIELLSLLMMAEPESDSKKGEQLRELATQLERYEQKKWPDRKPTPLEARRFRLEQMKPAEELTNTNP